LFDLYIVENKQYTNKEICELKIDGVKSDINPSNLRENDFSEWTLVFI